MNTVGAVRIRSSRPGLVTAAKPARTPSMSSCRSAPAPKKRLDCGQRDHRVVCLMRTVQRQENLGIHTAETLQFEQLASDGDLPSQHGEFGILACHRGVGANRLRQKHFHSLRQLSSDNRDGAEICA